MAITNFQVAANTSSAAFTASAETAVTVIYITNKTDGDGTVDIHVVPNGSSVSANFLVYCSIVFFASNGKL